MGKFGANFDTDCIVYSEAELKKYRNKCYGSSYWASMKTVLRHILDWQMIAGRRAYYPFSYDVASHIVLYMIENLKLAPQTLYGYVSVMKAMHEYQGFPLVGLEDKRLKQLLKGYKNIVNTLKPKINKRKVMHWETIQLLGSQLAKYGNMSYENTQTVWTSVLFTFWARARYGDFMPGSQGVVYEKLLTWERIQMPTDDHAAVYFHIPKEDREGNGVVKDIIRFDKNHIYCPIWNLEHLLQVRSQRRFVPQDEPVFLLDNDKLMSMAYVRKALSVMDKFYEASTGKLNCHSARAGLASYLASHPELYSAQEIKDLGNWKKDESMQCYTRTRGIGQRNTLRKLASNFRN